MTILDNTLLAEAHEIERQQWYAAHPIEWMEDYLGIPYWSLVWSQSGEANPEVVADKFNGVDPYATHDWVGDKDPLAHTMLDIAAGHKNVVCFGSRGFSKSFTIGGAGSLWYLDTHQPSRWVVFAPTVRQTKDEGFFNEVNKMIHMEGREGCFMDLHPRAAFRGNHFEVEPERHKTNWAASIRPATVVQGEDSAGVTKGLHHKNLVAFMEEYNEIKKPIRDAIEDTLTGAGNQFVVVANPGLDGDALHELIQRAGTRVKRGVALDHPNVVLDDGALVPGCTSRQYIHDRIATRSAQRLNIDPARMSDPYGPDYPTHRELSEDPSYAMSVLAEFSSVRTDTYVPASRFAPAKPLLIHPTEAVFFHEFKPTPALPMEGEVSVLKRPVWELDRVAGKPRKVWRRRYVVYMDTASSYEVTAANSGDRNKRDWHTAVVYDMAIGEVVAVARNRGPVYLHVLVALWLCDRFTLRYPKSPEEAGDESRWTGQAKPYLGWERNVEGGIPNMVFPSGQEALALGLIGPEAMMGSDKLPKGKHGWPWKSTRQYGAGMLYRPLSESSDPSVSGLFGVYVSGGNRSTLIGKLGRWAERIPQRPEIVRSPRLFAELGTFVESHTLVGGSEKVTIGHADGEHDDVIFGLIGCLEIADDLANLGKGPVASTWPDKLAEKPARLFREQRKAESSAFGGGFTSAF